MATNVGRDYFEIEAELKNRVEGDIRFDKYSRLLYSTDASIYQIEPIGVVVPRHKADVQAVLDVANRLGVSVLSRGGGTSLAGQAVGHSIVLDFSKYMQNVLEVNQEELWCRVQPGLVQDELNAYVRAMGLQFGPDTSTSNRATIGGMIGNNSSGAHSLTYGKTLDHVIELTVLLADGSGSGAEGFIAGGSRTAKARLIRSKGARTAKCFVWRSSTRAKFSRAIRKSCGGFRVTISTSSSSRSRSI